MDLFKIEGFVEDRHLPKVKRALVGLVHDLRDTPVINAAKGTDGKLKAATPGNIVALFMAWAAKHKIDDVNAAKMREFAQSVGRRPSASSYIIKMCQQAHVLRKLGKGTHSHYKVLPQRGGK